MAYPTIPQGRREVLEKHLAVLKDFLKELHGFDYKLELDIKTAPPGDADEDFYGQDVYQVQESSNWDASWC